MRHLRATIEIARSSAASPGPIGWLHERLFGLVARRGITAALAAAKDFLERG